MGKASKWFRGLLGLKKSSDPPPATTHADSKPSKEKRRWSFVKSVKEKNHHSTRPAIDTTTDNRRRGGSYGDASEPSLSSSSGYVDGVVDPNKHAIAVAAATAAVAEAAVAAAQAAAAVVRLTSSGRCNASTTTSTAYVSDNCGGISDDDDEWAAVKIQSAFRGYLARRALRALKGLVKLQALVRGHIVRKKTADTLRRMQVLLRAQARARVGRSLVSESPSSKSSHYHYTGPATPEKFEHALRAKSTRHDQPFMHKRNASKLNSRSVNEHDKSHLSWNWSDQRMDEGLWDQSGSTISYPIDDEKSDKILEIDPGKPHFAPKRRNLFHSSHHHHHHQALASDQNSHSFTTNSKDSTTHQTVMSTSSCEVQSLGPLKFTHEVEEGSFCTAENSPQFYSASSRGGGGSSRRGPFTPTQSDGSRSYLSGYSDHPNYMSYTESSKAKVRRSLSAPKQRPQFERSVSAKRYSVHGFGDSRSNMQRASSTLHSNFTSKAYPGSGRLDRLGMPVHVQGDAVGSATTDGFYERC